MNTELETIIQSEKFRTEHALKFTTNSESREQLRTKLMEIELIAEKTKNIIDRAEILDVLKSEVFKKQNIVKNCKLAVSKKRYAAARDIAIIILHRFKEPGE